MVETQRMFTPVIHTSLHESCLRAQKTYLLIIERSKVNKMEGSIECSDGYHNNIRFKFQKFGHTLP